MLKHSNATWTVVITVSSLQDNTKKKFESEYFCCIQVLLNRNSTDSLHAWLFQEFWFPAALGNKQDGTSRFDSLEITSNRYFKSAQRYLLTFWYKDLITFPPGFRVSGGWVPKYSDNYHLPRRWPTFHCFKVLGYGWWWWWLLGQGASVPSPAGSLYLPWQMPQLPKS